MTKQPDAVSSSANGIMDNIPKAKYTGNNYCKDDSHKYQLSGWSLSGAQRIKELTTLVVKNRLQYSMSFDMRMRKFVQLKQTTNTSRGKKRRATYTGDVITIQSDLDLDPSTMFPDHNANDFFRDKRGPPESSRP